MEQIRRALVKAAVIGTGWVAIGGGCATFDSCQQQLANRPTRRDLDPLAANDPIIQAYGAAITLMKGKPSGDKLNWTYQASIHNDHCPHGNFYFLPWHRYYLLYFERICRKLSGMPT